MMHPVLLCCKWSNKELPLLWSESNMQARQEKEFPFFALEQQGGCCSLPALFPGLKST